MSCCRKWDVSLCVFAEKTKKGPEMHNYEVNAEFHSMFSAESFSYATRFQRKWRMIENFECLGEYEKDF
jgi:hypothetical protein